MSSLFQPFQCQSLRLPNRVVMAPMTRYFSPGGVPTKDVADYYARRARGGAGLIFTEGAWIPHPAAANVEDVPRFYGEDALAGWRRVLERVRAEGGVIIPQLWHTGLFVRDEFIDGDLEAYLHANERAGPSGLVGAMGRFLPEAGRSMMQVDIDSVVGAYSVAASSAKSIGFDGVAIHGAHGYLIDQFFWGDTNARRDGYGGSPEERARFGSEVVKGIRAAVGPNFPIVLRVSQWKLQDYGAKLAQTPVELERLLRPLADAGVDIFDCSQRRFWDPEFPGSDLNLAGWTKKLSGKPTITVGSVAMESTFLSNDSLTETKDKMLDRLAGMLDREEFDLVAVGRAMLADPNWAVKVRRGSLADLIPFSEEARETLS